MIYHWLKIFAVINHCGPVCAFDTTQTIGKYNGTIFFCKEEKVDARCDYFKTGYSCKKSVHIPNEISSFKKATGLHVGIASAIVLNSPFRLPLRLKL